MPLLFDGDHLSRFSAEERGRRMKETYTTELRELGLE
jgi:hypothetical protein